jgi:hypothetical protein
MWHECHFYNLNPIFARLNFLPSITQSLCLCKLLEQEGLRIKSNGGKNEKGFVLSGKVACNFLIYNTSNLATWDMVYYIYMEQGVTRLCSRQYPRLVFLQILNHGQRQAEAVCLTAARCHCNAAPIETRSRMTRLSPNFFSDNYPTQRWVQKSHNP